MKFSKKHLNILFSLVFILSSQLSAVRVVNAAPEKAVKVKSTKVDVKEAISELVAFKYRPSPRDIIKAFKGNLPAENPFIGPNEVITTSDENGSVNMELILSTVNAIKSVGPTSIAKMEKAYPGASYFPAGRDGALFGDALEFFYDLLGEPNRVFRLYASGPTVRGLNSKTGPAFLESNGMGKRLKYPVLFIDNTNWRNTSQTYLLTQYAESLLLSKGLNKEQITQMLTTASIATGWVPDVSVEKNINQAKTNYLSRPLYLDQTLHTTFYAGGFWHSSMNPKLVTLPSGQQAGEIAQEFTADSKRVALAYMYEMMRVVMDESFYENVIKASKELGFEFTAKPKPVNFKIKKLTPAQILKVNFENTKAQLNNNAVELIYKQISFNANLFDAQKIDKYNQLITTLITPEQMDKLLVSAYAIALKAKSQTVEVEHLQAALDKVLPPTVTPATKLDFIISRLPVQTEEQEKYFSKNGAIVHGWLDQIEEKAESPLVDSLIVSKGNWSQVDTYTESAAELLFAITKGYEAKTLSSKDYRRLALQIIAYAQGASDKSLSVLGKEINKSAKLAKMMADKYEVFLTSDKYDEKARAVYTRLIELGHLPQPAVSCKDILKMVEKKKSEKEDEKKKKKAARGRG